MITRKEYADILLKQKEHGINMSSFMPLRMWIRVIGLAVIMVVTSILLILNDIIYGHVLFGYALCYIIYTFTLQRQSAKYWEYTKGFIDWDKVIKTSSEDRDLA